MKLISIIIIFIITILRGDCLLNSKSIEEFHNSIRINADATGPVPIKPLNEIKWSDEITSNVQRFVDKCEFGVPDKSYGIGNGYALWKVMNRKEFDAVTVLNATFQKASKLYDWSTASCKPGDQCCEAYPIMTSNYSTLVGCATSYCPNYSFFICGYNPMHFAGVRPYTAKSVPSVPIIEAITTNATLPFSLPPLSAAGDIDWRSLGFVTSIKDQGTCGSCWSFATVGILESAHLIKNNLPNKEIDLSEQNFVNCVNYGCAGGNGQMALDKLKASGVMYEGDLPYMGATLTCPAKSVVSLKSPPFKWLSYDNVEGSKESFLAALKIAPVYASLFVDDGFQLYKSGVYSCTKSATPNHAIVIVGYSSTTNSFLIKNSWGKYYGEQGYIQLKEGSCNLYDYSGISVKV